MATEKVPDPLGVSIMLSLESVGKHLSGHPTTDIYNRARPARNVGDAHNFPVFILHRRPPKFKPLYSFNPGRQGYEHHEQQSVLAKWQDGPIP